MVFKPPQNTILRDIDQGKRRGEMKIREASR